MKVNPIFYINAFNSEGVLLGSERLDRKHPNEPQMVSTLKKYNAAYVKIDKRYEKIDMVH